MRRVRDVNWDEVEAAETRLLQELTAEEGIGQSFGQMPMSLTFTASQWQEMLTHVDAELPNEACGLLGGEGGLVRRVYAVENAARSPWEYRMDSKEQVRVLLEIEGAGWELSGIYHSHPSGPAGPSTTDVARAYYPEAVYVILSPEAAGGWRARGFRLDEGQVEEVGITVVT